VEHPVGTVTVVKANTKTVGSLVYKAKKDKLIGKATVTAPQSGAALIGNVKMLLKRNGEVFSSQTKTLNDSGVASVKWSKPKNGKYKLVAKYLGTPNFNTSGGTAKRKVS